ncbi:MAG TPA: hypothetical protein VKE40_27695 [Gemmataceae bacterium]|nr:hypothetical protein [Gemmataceae bacterium]
MHATATCPSCGVRVRLPDQAAGRRFRCPRCHGVIAVPPAAPAGAVALDPPAAVDPPPAESCNPFADEAPAPSTGDAASPKDRKRRPTARPRAVDGYNPFDDSTEDAAGAPRPRKYRKGSGYNPFDGAAEESDAGPTPEEVEFQFGVEGPPAAPPSSDFDFGPPDPRGPEAHDRRRRRR